ncbi:uncharacterized protein LOC121982590 [Zingiber officinale]|uniref:uncharacterized protein LOC121982590 n=1 Tax=Zingiber officinale TaxID=94328 RepID=UPI001C4CA69F|nr:uncharacterized protein LOC121982590 [Zingiber officinale]
MLQNLVQGVAVRLHSNPIRRVAPSICGAAAGGVYSISSERNKKMQKEEDDNKKEEQQQQQEDPPKDDHHHGDMMAHSFGEGYSTRSDEEGFGGIYSRNQVFGNPSQGAHTAADFDKSQGSEVKEKEKARNQPH